ncbi:MAG TPA: TetR/AcrR family transcriptional regulator [Caulobacteraceae bacterium]|jgi:AcrR family transcriptional regulator|nr:TetR/AcrR family transcriptional regulator [Caulobacteraceae bacterium]
MGDAAAKVRDQAAEKPGPRMRSRLLDAAASRFKQFGLAAVSVAEIAADAGAFPSQVTYYFGTKEALFVEAACREMLYLARDAEAASAHPKNEDDYLETLVRSVISAPGLNLFVEALALAHRRTDLQPQVQRTFERLYAESDRALRDHRAQQGQPQGRTDVPAHRFWVIALGMGARGGATGEPHAFLAAEMMALLGGGRAGPGGTTRVQGD